MTSTKTGGKMDPKQVLASVLPADLMSRVDASFPNADKERLVKLMLEKGSVVVAVLDALVSTVQPKGKP